MIISVIHIDRKGVVRKRVFFNLLDCMDFILAEETQNQIIREYSVDDKNQSIKYEEAIKLL